MTATPNESGSGWKMLDKNSPVSLGLVIATFGFCFMIFIKMAEVKGAVDLNRKDFEYMRRDVTDITDSVREIERSIKGIPSREEFSSLKERVRKLEGIK